MCPILSFIMFFDTFPIPFNMLHICSSAWSQRHCAVDCFMTTGSNGALVLMHSHMSTRGALVLMDIMIFFNIVQDVSLLKNKATSFVVTQLCHRYEVHVL